MSTITEIYICKEGQRLEEGHLQVSREIATREQAEADAFELCRMDPSIHRVAYYRIDDNGDHKLFHSYTNKKVETRKPARTYVSAGFRIAAFQRRRGLLKRLLSRFSP